jgi:hypothetical protein
MIFSIMPMTIYPENKYNEDAPVIRWLEKDLTPGFQNSLSLPVLSVCQAQNI